jgi:2-iminobutanoate/2-iminopropanoate deaminase
MRMWIAAALVALAGGAAWAQPKEVISTPNAPAAIGPYSQAIKVGNMLFLAGQVAIDPKTGKLIEAQDIESQTKLTLDNLKAVVEAGGMTMDDIVTVSVFLADLNDFAKMNAIYATYFKDKPPARATVQVARLPLNARVEIAAIAAR